MRDRRAEMRAATEISVNWRPEGGAALSEAATSPSALPHLGRLPARGQESGEFGTFNRRVMATALQRALDGLPFPLEADPDADLDEYADELAALFARATRGAGPSWTLLGSPDHHPAPDNTPSFVRKFRHPT
ncbi:hypothetical protein ACIBP6_17215 [Nonomuraea terrae]|uniref:hypothetical protein n=1 Tax=Nonomuraea terrae TaxID=2530383 RepID=UPI0037AF283E